MQKIVIWHNPRCRKSREGLKTAQTEAEKRNIPIQIRKYLDNPPTEAELKEILKKSGLKPQDILRKQEKIWKENFKNKNLSGEELLKIMARYPKLIERPIVIYGDKAVLGRPAEKIKELFE
jgi:arsenate reductase